MKTMLAMIQSLRIVGGATQSIFPQVEAMLLGSGDYQRALEFAAARKKMGRYHSVIDFLFCELHPEWRMACRRFYAGNGPQLKDQITPEQLVEFNERLLKAIEVAHDLFCEQRRKSWAGTVNRSRRPSGPPPEHQQQTKGGAYNGTQIQTPVKTIRKDLAQRGFLLLKNK
jgi:hypothetical protein